MRVIKNWRNKRRHEDHRKYLETEISAKLIAITKQPFQKILIIKAKSMREKLDIKTGIKYILRKKNTNKFSSSDVVLAESHGVTHKK